MIGRRFCLFTTDELDTALDAVNVRQSRVFRGWRLLFLLLNSAECRGEVVFVKISGEVRVPD